MAKRGEKRPYRVAFRWPNGVAGVATFTTPEGAELSAETIASNGRLVGSRVAITITDTRTGITVEYVPTGGVQND